ncbi:MAG TPA: hypothetical protein VFX50_16760, partial [Gemmatimonadales bacterium]|nr:hypothetical protein [Gemmatimonadales bacterium]
VGLAAGWTDAQSAARNLALVAHRDRPAGFVGADRGDFSYVNADFAFRDSLLFMGGWNGVQVWNVGNPRAPSLRATIVCPGGQGDVSVHGTLLFMSVEEPRGRLDCGPQGVKEAVSAERFMGVRIFDITDLDHARQVAAVQTCRGSHTHTLVPDPRDPSVVYVYVSGTGPVRSASELAGCSGLPPEQDSTTSLYQVEVIRVPVAAPQDAKVIRSARLFADSATGRIAGLWRGGAHGEGTQQTDETDQCHDITVYPALGLAAGACSGNGLLIDISDPSNPRRIAEVSDPNFAYWHSATFSNDGSKVLFSDEWGGGTAPRCRTTDRPQWGADAIFTRSGQGMTFAGYYKLPAAQTATENCVAHNGSLIPVPGRDILAQGWYQGGVSIFDFSDPAKPVEIAFFDRGPVVDSALTLGGHWGAYWYNGHIYGSEIARGLDVLALEPSAQLSRNEIEAALLVRTERANPQMQERITWPAHFSVARSYLDQLGRNDGLAA